MQYDKLFFVQDPLHHFFCLFSKPERQKYGDVVLSNDVVMSNLIAT